MLGKIADRPHPRNFPRTSPTLTFPRKPILPTGTRTSLGRIFKQRGFVAPLCHGEGAWTRMRVHFFAVSGLCITPILNMEKYVLRTIPRWIATPRIATPLRPPRLVGINDHARQLETESESGSGRVIAFSKILFYPNRCGEFTLWGGGQMMSVL
jgi:hypothetical protein